MWQAAQKADHQVWDPSQHHHRHPDAARVHRRQGAAGAGVGRFRRRKRDGKPIRGSGWSEVSFGMGKKLLPSTRLNNCALKPKRKNASILSFIGNWFCLTLNLIPHHKSESMARKFTYFRSKDITVKKKSPSFVDCKTLRYRCFDSD